MQNAKGKVQAAALPFSRFTLHYLTFAPEVLNG
jgi:hypothetical protein